MKKIAFLCMGLVLIIVVVPILSGFKLTNTKFTDKIMSKKSTGSEMTLNIEDAENIICTVLNFADEDDTDEYKKALIVLCKNNYIYQLMNNSPTDVSVRKYSDSEYKKLSDLYENLDTKLYYKGEIVNIPILENCGINTTTDDEYPYITAVASPWDAFCYNYNADISYPCGISLYGIEVLCSQGYTHKEAISWYLPLFDIT